MAKLFCKHFFFFSLFMSASRTRASVHLLRTISAPRTRRWAGEVELLARLSRAPRFASLPSSSAPSLALRTSPCRHVSPRIPPPHAEEYSPQRRRVPQFLIKIKETPGARCSKRKLTGELPERYLRTQLCLAREKKALVASRKLSGSGQSRRCSAHTNTPIPPIAARGIFQLRGGSRRIPAPGVALGSGCERPAFPNGANRGKPA